MCFFTFFVGGIDTPSLARTKLHQFTRLVSTSKTSLSSFSDSGHHHFKQQRSSECSLDEIEEPPQIINNFVTVKTEASSTSEDFFQQNSTKKLMHAINELLESERTYISSLRKIIEDYVPELGRLDVPQSLRGQVHNLFGNIEPIFNFHCYRFLPELLVSITENNNKEENPTIAQLLKNMSQCFLKNRASFDLYKYYWENKPKSDVLLENREARAFLQKRQMQLGDKLDLSSFLLKPVQRLTKYQQILRAIIDILMSLHSYLLKKNGETVSKEFTEIKCEELDLLNQAEDMIKWFLRQGNDILAAELIKDCPWNYKTEGGRLIRQDNLHQVVGSKLSVRRVFLFEKLIIICKPKLEFSHLTDTNQRFVFKDGLKTNEFGLTRRKETNSDKNSDKRFEIWQTLPNKTNSLSRLGKKVGLAKKFNTKMNSFIFEAENEDQKNLWVQDIETLHWEQMKVFRQQRQNVSFGLIDLNKESKESIRDRSVVVRLRNKNNLVTQNQNNNNNCHERRFSTGARLHDYIRPLETSLEETSLDDKTDSVESGGSVSIQTRPVSMMLPTNIPRTVLSNFKRNSKERASSVFSNSFKYIDKNPVQPVQVHVPLFNFNHKPKIGGIRTQHSPIASPNSNILRNNTDKKRVLPDKTRPYSIVSINSSSSGNSSAGPVCKYSKK